MKTGDVYLFDCFVRLMCPMCMLISNDHHTSEYFKYKVNGHNNATFVVYHTCKQCGHCDDCGIGFVDSSMYSDGEIEHIDEYKGELRKLERKVAALRNEIERITSEFADKWQTADDVHL